MAFFPFNGVKNSFYGDLHATGKDGVRFFTENKVEIVRFLSEPEAGSAVLVQREHFGAPAATGIQVSAPGSLPGVRAPSCFGRVELEFAAEARRSFADP